MPVPIDATFAPRDIYATIEDVRARNRSRTFSATSVPNASDVYGFLEQTAAEINAQLVQKGYALPVPTVAADALEYLRSINALGAHMLVEMAAPSGRKDAVTDARALWQNALKMLSAAETVLDIPRDSSRASPRGPGVSQPTRLISPYFTRNMQF